MIQARGVDEWKRGMQDPFDNDDAADWACAFEHADAGNGLALIETTLRTAAQVPANGLPGLQ